MLCSPSQPVTNAIQDPCYIPMGMVTDAMRFPNLVSGFERSPIHAARAALHPRYTKYEWNQNNVGLYNEADTNRNFSQRLRDESLRVIRELDESSGGGLQQEVTRRIGERMTDIQFWKNEGAAELAELVEEIGKMQDKKRSLEKAIQDIEGPIHIAQECLHHREARMGIDLVCDESEQALMKELSIFRICQEKLCCMLEKALEQQENNRAAQHDLERDVKSKEDAIRIDRFAHELQNCSRGLRFHGGIEQFDPTLSTQEEWADNSNKTIQRAQLERHKSAQMRSDIDALILLCANEIWTAWDSTNMDLESDFQTAEVKRKMEMHLRKVQDEMFAVEKYMELLRKAIDDKSRPLKVAHTRLEVRSHRRDIELCKDEPHTTLIKEVDMVRCSIEILHRKLLECEAKHQQLLTTRSNLEQNLEIKANSLFIDQEKCLGMRRSFPIRSLIYYPKPIGTLN
ncbi:Tektin-3 [Gryllus bimaculatus]|nr:Tektin-3 [Gryllus bimaculatus]